MSSSGTVVVNKNAKGAGNALNLDNQPALMWMDFGKTNKNIHPHDLLAVRNP
jgi:hypothetical protein